MHEYVLDVGVGAALPQVWHANPYGNNLYKSVWYSKQKGGR